MSEELVANDSSLTLVRGWYFDPIWNREEPHWWCKKEDGTIVDPTKLQFPSGGISDFYREFEGSFDCAACGEVVKEEDAIPHGNYGFCSGECVRRFVGV